MMDDESKAISQMLESLGASDEEVVKALVAATDDESTEEQRATNKVPLNVMLLPGETREAASARVLLRPDIMAAESLEAFGRDRFSRESQDTDLNELVAQLESQIDKVASGDLTILEQTLAAQTYTLNALFHMLLRRSGRNMGVYTQSAWEYMKLALRAQAQCRSTVEALAEMKKPRPEILRQTNIAHGHQQVNNQLPAIGENPPNELMEQQYERLDPGTPSEAVKGGQAVETVGEEHGAEND